MSANQSSAKGNLVPTITRAGTRPELTCRLFVNIPVSDLQRSIRFYEALGFTFNRQLTDASATCMLVAADVYFMLISTERFRKCSKRPLGDLRHTTSARYAISVESREAVTATVSRALECGAGPAADPEDYGYMYVWSFFDLDGHHFEVFWTDPAPFSVDGLQLRLTPAQRDRGRP
jgi:predicted lactoylglutathione lyase